MQLTLKDHLAYMKPIILILSLLLASELRAQKLYAFSQRIVPGTRQSTMDKDGNVTMGKRKEHWTHPLYLEIPASKKIKVTEVWLNGEKYAFDTATVTGPILEETGLSIPGRTDRTLIPETKNQLLQIMLREKINVTDKHNRKLTDRKKVVVYYTRNGKKCHLSTDNIQELPEMLMQ
jgi:hypothetical protein